MKIERLRNRDITIYRMATTVGYKKEYTEIATEKVNIQWMDRNAYETGSGILMKTMKMYAW